MQRCLARTGEYLWVSSVWLSVGGCGGVLMVLPVASAADDTLTEGQLQAWMEGEGPLPAVPHIPMCIIAACVP